MYLNISTKRTPLKLALLLVSAFCLTGCLFEEELEEDRATQAPSGGDSSTGNSPPKISGTPPSATKVGEAYAFEPAASDPDGDPLTFSIANKPGWLSFDAATGAVSGTPQTGDEGTYNGIKVTASDGSASDSLSFSVSVTTVATGSVTLSWNPPMENTDGTALDDLAGYRIYYGLSEGNYPNRVVVDNAGLTNFVVDNLSPNTYYFVATAVNSSGIESDFSNVATKTVVAN